jgi:hypothetical protein
MRLFERYEYKVEWGIDLKRYRVCQALEPLIYTATSLIERADRLVAQVAIEPLRVRALAEKLGEDDIRVVVEVPLPAGFYANLVQLSEGEAEPWPAPSADATAKWFEICDALQAALYPPDGPFGARAWMNHRDYIDLLKTGRFDPNTTRQELQRGFFGVYTHADDMHKTEGLVRRREVWVSKHVALGTVQLLPPGDLPLNDPLFKSNPKCTYVIWPNGRP